MPADNKSNYIVTAVKAARTAGAFILENLGKISNDDIDIKQTSDFVTYVDKESEELIINTIQNVFPGHHFLAEESIKDNAGHEYRWIIDPLDGTTNFIHSYPAFCVSIALEHNNEIILGVIFDPQKNELFTAEKGKGAFLNDHPIKISTITDMSSCLVTTGFPFKLKEMMDPYLKLFKNILFRVSDIRRAGSAALDLAHLACGRCEAFFEIGLSPWDIAAGVIMIKEAGGIVTDFGGGTDYMTTGNIVAGAPAIHPEILKEVKGVFEGTVDK